MVVQHYTCSLTCSEGCAAERLLLYRCAQVITDQVSDPCCIPYYVFEVKSWFLKQGVRTSWTAANQTRGPCMHV